MSNGAKDPNWRRSKNYNFIRIELKSNYNVKKNVEAERTERCMFLLLRKSTRNFFKKDRTKAKFFSISNWRRRLFNNHTKPDAGKNFFDVFTVFGDVKLFSTFVLPTAAPSLVSLTTLPPSAAANFFLQ